MIEPSDYATYRAQNPRRGDVFHCYAGTPYTVVSEDGTRISDGYREVDAAEEIDYLGAPLTRNRPN